jgi:aspartate aminotransferase
MISEKMQEFVKNSSAIRAMFEEGKKMAEKFGADRVYDFSLGNPNVPAPQEVEDALVDIVTHEDPLKIHGYMNNSGFDETRTAIAGHLNELYHTRFTADNLVMTSGAGGALNVILKTLLNPGDQVVTFVPYFGEYRSYVANFDGVLVESPTDSEHFYPDFAALKERLTPKTRALIINSPNNPTGAVYPEEVLVEIASILTAKEQEYGTDIYLISDEPYRDIVYGNTIVPWVTGYYHNAVVASSYSKSLSLPGERIGYLVLPDELSGAKDVMAAANVASRILGFINAPSLMQLVVARCQDAKADVAFYEQNRDDLYGALMAAGFECAPPDGAFYLWVKSPVEDEREFVKAAKEEEHILLVQGRSFGCPGWVRIAYCVSHETILNSLPGFERLAEKYQL